MKKNPLPGLLATKRVWVPQPDPEAPPVRMVLQRTGAGFGNVEGFPHQALQLRAHVIPADPRTAEQIANRARFASAQSAWYALDPSAREEWTRQANPHHLTGRQYFTRAYIRSQPLETSPTALHLHPWPATSQWPASGALWPVSYSPPYTVTPI